MAIRTRRGLAILAVVLTCAATALAAEEQVQWNAVFLGDTKIGYSRDVRRVEGREVTHETRMEITFQRGQAEMDISVETRMVETLDGRPLRFATVASLGPLGERRSEGEIRDGKIHLASSTGGQQRRRVVDYPEGALMPEGVSRLLADRPFEAGATGDYLLFDADSVSGVRCTYRVRERESVPLMGRIERLWPVEQTMRYGLQSLTALAYLDEEQQARKLEMSMLGMKLTIVACDEAFARSPNGRIDIMDSASVAAPEAIRRARNATDVRFELRPVEGAEAFELPDTGAQRIRTDGEGTIHVRVRLPQVERGERPYDGNDPAALAALQPSDYVESRNRQIRQQAEEIVGDQADALRAARQIERWVSRHIRDKDLSVGYATAVETLRSRQGDCTEHAVLTAALCRAAGIPCRLVMGIAYADDFLGQRQRFIGHAWNEAYVGGEWITLDAALGADAARIALALGGDDPTAFLGILRSLGNFTIASVEVDPAP